MKLILFKKDINFKGKIFVTGFHGVGYVGFLTVQHLTKALKARRIGHVITNNHPPLVSVSQRRLVLPYELFQVDNFVLLTLNVPLNQEDAQEFCFKLGKWIIKKKFKEAILFGGLDSSVKRDYDSSELRVVATSEFLRLNKVSEPILEEGLYVVGPLAYLLMVFESLNFPAITVLPYATVSYPDPRAAAKAISYFEKRYGVKVDVKELIQQAEEVEKMVSEVKKQLEKLGRKEATSKTLYI